MRLRQFFRVIVRRKQIVEFLINTFGAKLCCIAASGLGGITDQAIRRKFKIMEIVVALLIGVGSAEIFIPALMSYFQFDKTIGVAIAFIIGYCGIRLLPMIEAGVKKRLEK